MKKRRGWKLAEVCVAAVLLLSSLSWTAVLVQAAGQAVPARQIATTTVTDTVYRADGTAASGTVLISWPAFVTAMGASVPAGSTTTTIGAGGSLSVALVANSGSTPMGSYYTVIYHLSDGTVTREYWVVPASTYPVQVAAIRSTVLPATVAMQTVSKAYVDNAIAAAASGTPLDSTPYVLKAGDTMTGALNLPGDPAASLQAADKNYVDNQVAGLAGGLAQKVSTLPVGTQTVVQPAGTQLGVNTLNAVQYAGQFASVGVGNGIANAAASANCTSGCDVIAEHGYSDSERVGATALPAQTHVSDRRDGEEKDTFFNPLNRQYAGLNLGKSIDVVSTQSASSILAQTGSGIITSLGLEVNEEGLTGGSNVYPESIQGTTPYFKTTNMAVMLNGTNNTLGQHVLMGENQNCYAVGDCLMGGLYMLSSGGFRDEADEGAHPFDLQFAEDSRVFTGTCAGGCTPGSTILQVGVTSSPGTQGEGRYLIDKNPAGVLTAGFIAGGDPTSGRQPLANFSGTSFPVSTFFAIAQTIPTQANQIAPGTVNVAILTSGVPPGFANSTGALSANSGVACVSDVQLGSNPSNFETAAYTVTDGTHLTLTLIRPHASGATVAIGGLCGYGLEQTADTINGIRQVFPVIGSPTATSLLYAGGQTAIVGVQKGPSAYINLNLVVSSIARSGNVVTVTTAGNFPVDVNGLTLHVQGVADSSYNGSFLVTSTGPNTLNFSSAGPNSTSTGGTLTYNNGGFALYPMAEVLSVYDTSTKAIDGQLTLAANNVPWASGDVLEEPHYFQERVAADVEYVTQYEPRSTQLVSGGIHYQGNNGPGLTGWEIVNTTPNSSYYGNGGTHSVPNIGVRVAGAWNSAVDLQAGETAAIATHCNSHGCNAWDSTYNLLQMDSATGVDSFTYSPSASTLNLYLRGVAFQFTPSGFTASTINVGTINATSIHGALSGSFTGSITPASLPVFLASGAGHAAGAVPDPGPTAGTTRYLREDGTWAAGGQGAQGPAGAQGPIGLTGAAGAQGPAGPAGQTGAAGVAGVAGATGPAGAAGAVGPQGPAGAAGAPGATGAAGATGAMGATGPAGPTIAATSTSLGAVQLAAGQSSAVLGTAAGQSISAFAANTGLGVVAAARGGSGFSTLDTLYDFTNQSGTIVSDRIGSSNGTLGGTVPPTWTGNGLAFTPGSNVALPAALNTEKTFYFAVYINPITFSSQTNNVYPTLLSSSTGGTGFNVVLEGPGSISSGLSDFTYSLTLYPNALSTASLNTLSGFNVVTIVCGTGSGNLDHFYINGSEVSYSTQASNCGDQNTGNLYLGSSQTGPWSGGFFPGTIYGFAASSAQHTLAQVQQNVSAFFALANAKGVATTAPALNQAAPQLLAVGDSITAGANSATPYTSLLTLSNQPAYTITNEGIIGIRLASILSHEANRMAPRCSTQGGPAVAILEAGTNDLASGNSLSPQAVWNEAAAWAGLMRRAGCIPFVTTMISRTGSGYSGQTMDALKDSYDALIVQQAKAVGFAGVLDIAANPILGADGANNPGGGSCAASTYFQSDCTHPTTAGNTLLAKEVSNGLNWYFGYNETNPHIVTALSVFTMACSDAAIDLSGLTAAGNITLPDCTGASGTTFRINNPQSTYAVTVTADSTSHPVNGSTSAVTVPASGSLTLRLVPNSKTAAGWHWEY